MFTNSATVLACGVISSRSRAVWRQAARQEANPGQIAAGMGKTFDETFGNGITADHRHNRNCRGACFAAMADLSPPATAIT
jgi:hypothetical protein